MVRRKLPILILLAVIVFLAMNNVFNNSRKKIEPIEKPNIMPGYMFDMSGKNISCSTKDSNEMISVMCQKYNSDLIDGSLCDSFCRFHDIAYQNCTKDGQNKEVIFVKCNGVCQQGQTIMAVMKSRHTFLDILPDFQIKQIVLEFENLTSMDGFEMAYADKNDFIHAYDLFKRGINRLNIFSKMYGSLYGNPPRSYGDSSHVTSLWRLLSQREFRFMAMHQDASFIPKLYGTCGGYYVTEYIKSMTTKGDSTEYPTKWNGNWPSRVHIALRILGISNMIDSGFQEPLYFCDFTQNHFGMNNKNEVKIIDVDSLHDMKSLVLAMRGTQCKDDKDCFLVHVVDCKAVCNKETGHCIPGEPKSNLQKTCEEILFGGEKRTMQEGLLYNPPVELVTKIHSTLENCLVLDQSEEYGANLNITPETVYTNLTTVLQKELERIRNL